MIVVERVDKAPVVATARDLLEVGKGVVKAPSRIP